MGWPGHHGSSRLAAVLAATGDTRRPDELRSRDPGASALLSRCREDWQGIIGLDRTGVEGPERIQGFRV